MNVAPHCGHPKGDTIHLIWQCPTLKHIRFKKAPRLEQLIVEACPAYFLLGIPGAFPALPFDWFAQPLPQIQSNVEFSFGLGMKFQSKKVFDYAYFVKAFGEDLVGLNYLQASARLLQQPSLDFCPRMAPIRGCPPPGANTWSDGSRARPSSGHFSTMSFGLWTPGVQQQPPESLLASIALPIDCPAGLDGSMYAGLLVGQLGSSTRAEAAPARSTPARAETAAEAPADPEDWSDELAALELQLQRLGWQRDQESIYLQRAFGHPSRSRLTSYGDLVAYLAAVRQLRAPADPASVAVPLRRADLLVQSDQLLAQLGWDAARGREALEKHFECSSRQQLNDGDLLRFNMILEGELITGM